MIHVEQNQISVSSDVDTLWTELKEFLVLRPQNPFTKLLRHVWDCRVGHAHPTVATLREMPTILALVSPPEKFENRPVAPAIEKYRHHEQGLVF